MEITDIGKFIEKHRIASGYRSQRQLAEKSGVSSATLSRIEAGIQKPQPETLKQLTPFLKTTSLVELMVICGYWDEDELITSIDGNNPHIAKETQSQYGAEKEFLEKIDLSDEELLKQFKLTVDGRELTEKEIKKLLAFVRMERDLD